MSISGIQGQLLEVTVFGCFKLKDTEWISRQDPYVCLEYGSTKFRTRTCTDGGKNPVFQEKFVFNLIEGLREINVVVWNSNTLTFDDYIGSGKIQIQDVLVRGYDDRAWPLQTKTGRYAGEVKLIMHFANANKPNKSSAPSAPPYAAPPHRQPQVSMYSAPPAPSMSHLNPTSAYPPPPPTSYPPSTAYPPPPAAYASTSPYPYAPNPSAYPPYPYPPPPDQSTYPPAAYPPPPSTYPPQPYPPPHHAPPYSHSGHYPGLYPPPY